MTQLRTIKLLALAGLFAAPLAARQEGPRTYAARPTAGEIRAQDAMSRLYVLADDSMKGRQSGQRGNVMATGFIAAELRRAGLEPMGENGTFFPAIPLPSVRSPDPGAVRYRRASPTARRGIHPPVSPTGGRFRAPG